MTQAAEWQTGKINDVSEKVGIGPFGSSIRVNTFVPNGIPIISGQHLRKVRIDEAPGFNFITQEHAQRLANANVQRGDVVFTYAGNIGQVSYIPADSQFERYVISQRQFYMRCERSKVIPEYVALYFKSPEGQHKLLANSSQVGVPMIAQPVTYLRSIEIPIPPLPEQRAIAHVLGTLDDKIELNRRMNRTLEEMARAIFHDWFVDFGPTRAKMEGQEPYLPPELWGLFPDELVDSELGEIPEGWEVRTLGDLCTMRAGSVFPKAMQGKRDGAYPFIKVSDMNLTGNSVGILHANNWVEDVDLHKLKAKPMPTGTIVFAKIGEALKQNRLRITSEATIIDNNMMGALANEKAISPIMLLRSLSRFDFAEVAVGTALPYLTVKDLSALNMVLPPIEEQTVMARYLQVLHNKVIANERASLQLGAIRNALLPQLISGKLDVSRGKC